MRAILSVVAMLCLIGSASASDYPDKPVRMLVGWAPGGITDVAARVVAERLSEKWHQQVIVDNRSGASGMIADAMAARAVPDGYTLLMASSPEVTTTPFIQKGAENHFNGELLPVGIVSINPVGIVVPADSPYKTLKDLIAAAKQKPGAIGYSSPGLGTAPHLAAVTFEKAAGIKLQHVPYRGGGPAALATASKQVPVGFNAMAGVMGMIKGGKLRVLGVASSRRIPWAPDWPTIAEQGVANSDYSVWAGLFVPRGVPADIVKKLHADLTALLAEPDVAKKFSTFGAVPASDSLSTFEKRIKSETVANKTIVVDNHLQN